MIESARLILDYMVGMTKEQFLEDSLRHDAVIRRLLLLAQGADGRPTPAFAGSDITPELAWDIRRGTVPETLRSLAPPLHAPFTPQDLDALDAPPFELTTPSEDGFHAFLEYAVEVAEADGKRYHDFLDLDEKKRREYFETRQLRELPPEAPAGLVPQTNLWLVSPEARLLGIVRFRHYLNDGLRLEGGHIGYEVAPTARRRNLGTVALHRTLGWIRDRRPELADVLITCDSDNVGSRKIIERNGGLLIASATSKRSGKEVLRFVIDL